MSFCNRRHNGGNTLATYNFVSHHGYFVIKLLPAEHIHLEIVWDRWGSFHIENTSIQICTYGMETHIASLEFALESKTIRRLAEVATSFSHLTLNNNILDSFEVDISPQS